MYGFAHTTALMQSRRQPATPEGVLSWAGRVLARGPSDYATDDARGIVGHYAFGSYHPGVCNFTLGDGSVQAFSVTTDPQLLVYLTVVNDGHSVAVP